MIDKEKILRAIKLKIDENCIEVMQDIYEKALDSKDNDLTKINIKINELEDTIKELREELREKEKKEATGEIINEVFLVIKEARDAVRNPQNCFAKRTREDCSAMGIDIHNALVKRFKLRNYIN